MVLNAALSNPKIKGLRMVLEQQDAVQWLQDKLEVNFISGSELLEIALKGDQPTQLADLVNAIKDSYLGEVVDVEAKRRTRRHDYLKKLKEQFNESMKGQRANLRKLAETVGSDDRQTLAMKQQFALEHLAQVRHELLDVQSQKRKAEA